MHMFKKQANKLGIPLSKTRMSIHPYASQKMKCCGYYVGTVMYGDNVANIGIYVLNKNVETIKWESGRGIGNPDIECAFK